MSVNKNSNLYFLNPIIILDTTESSNASTGSLVLYGGLSVGSNTSFTGVMKISNANTNVSTGATLDVSGNARFTTSVTSAALYSTNLTSTNVVATNFSAATLSLNNANISIATINNFTSTNALLTNATASSLFVNSVNMSPSSGDIFKELSFSGSNNVTTGTAVTSLAFNNSIVRSFNAQVSVTVVRTVGGNLNAQYELKGIQVNNNWILNDSYIGDNTTITFTINASGQVLYTSSNIENWTSTNMKFRAFTTSI